jgi:hypothetical protein
MESLRYDFFGDSGAADGGGDDASAGGDAFPLDNITLSVRSGAEADGGGGGGASRGFQHVDAAAAYADFTGAIPPPPDPFDEVYSSCSEEDMPWDDEEEEEEEGEGGGDPWAPGGALARGDHGARNVDALIGSGGMTGTRGGRMECFGCMFTSQSKVTRDDANIPATNVARLLRIFDELYTRMDNIALARIMHVYFKNEIYLPLRRRGLNVPMWRTRQIHEHFFCHILDPRITIGEQIRDYIELRRALKTCTFTRSSNETKYDKDGVNLLRSVDAQLIRLYTMDTDKMNFANPDCFIDFAATGKRINPYRNFRTGFG